MTAIITELDGAEETGSDGASFNMNPCVTRVPITTRVRQFRDKTIQAGKPVGNRYSGFVGPYLSWQRKTAELDG